VHVLCVVCARVCAINSARGGSSPFNRNAKWYGVATRVWSPTTNAVPMTTAQAPPTQACARNPATTASAQPFAAGSVRPCSRARTRGSLTVVHKGHWVADVLRVAAQQRVEQQVAHREGNSGPGVASAEAQQRIRMPAMGALTLSGSWEKGRFEEGGGVGWGVRDARPLTHAAAAATAPHLMLCISLPQIKSPSRM
jgi:hypothetical protein